MALDINPDEIEIRKQSRRDLWAYREVDHIPVFIWPTWSFGYTPRQQLEDGQIQFEVNVKTIEKCLELLPDDYIPWARVTCGYMTIATMFGMNVHWSENQEQPPGVDGHLISDLEQVYTLECPGMDAGLMPENVRRLRYHTQNLPPDVYITGIDSGGPLNTIRDLLETNLLYTGFYDNPGAMHYLLDIVTDLHLQIYRTVVRAVGGTERMTTIDFDPVWAPEQHKGFVSDDVCATVGPDIFREFGIPYNNRLLVPWGHGVMHNCGPNPCKHLYLEHEPKLKGLNLAYKYSQADFPELREFFAGWGVFTILYDNEFEPGEMLDSFRNTMETLAPDVVAIPCVFVDDSWHDDDVVDLYWQMRQISEEYAASMNWAD